MSKFWNYNDLLLIITYDKNSKQNCLKQIQAILTIVQGYYMEGSAFCYLALLRWLSNSYSISKVWCFIPVWRWEDELEYLAWGVWWPQTATTSILTTGCMRSLVCAPAKAMVTLAKRWVLSVKRRKCLRESEKVHKSCA